MRHIHKLTAVAATLGLTFGAMSSAHALTTFASYGADPTAVTNLSWTNTGFDAGTLANVANDTGSESGATDTVFSFLTGGLPTGLAADFDLNATSTSSALTAFGVLVVQPGITGDFHFTYDGVTKTIGGVTFTHGANLLSGSFTNAYIQGIVGGGVASANAEINTLGPITFTSDFLTFDPTGDEGISLAFNSILAPLHIKGPGDTLANFKSSTTGNFSADGVGGGGGGGTPEPATWIMMLVGLGGAGAVLRRGRSAVQSLRPL